VESLVVAPGEDERIRAAVAAFSPDLVQVGPVTSPGWDVIGSWSGPLIATSWGFDLMDEIESDPSARERARAVLERADLVFVDNDGSRRVAAQLGADASKTVKFAWGLEREWLDQVSLDTPAGPPKVFLTTRRHESIYRVEDVLEAFANASRDLDIHLIVAGSGTRSAALRVMAEAAPRPDRIEFVGEVDRDMLRKLYARADAYVTASSVDGTSVSLLEAMALGTPVIASAIEGNAEWVTDDTGFSFAIGDVSGLAARIRELATAGSAEMTEITRRVINARRRINESADWTATTARFPGFAQTAIDHHTG
jgi:glycosyltransferase involved in cell wall biosynthesis